LNSPQGGLAILFTGRFLLMKTGFSRNPLYNHSLMRPLAFLLSAVLVALAATPAAAPLKGRAMGAPGAPITIDVFSDFQCPACKNLYEQTLVPLMRDYVATGKVYLIHHEFPLPNHAYSLLAASYACAAARLGKYDEVASLLFRNQAVWESSGKLDEIVTRGFTPAEAKTLRSLIQDPSVIGEIKRDIELGTQAGVHQTPTMIITRRSMRYPLAGGINYDLLRRFLDDQLAK
jgi:protein-disulfide isomerase